MHVEYPAPEAVQDSIRCFWYERKDLAAEPTRFDVMPDGYAEIIFHFGNDCSILQYGALKKLPSPFLMGLLNQPAIFYGVGKLEIIGIRCFPWTVFDLLGLTAGADAVRTFEHPIARLHTPLAHFIRSGDIEAALACVREYVQDARLKVDKNSLLFKAGEAMRRSKGNLPVTQVADAAHATVRTLERNFKRSSGHTVKDVSGLMRFEQVRNRLWLYPKTNIAALAAELGYTDQSHLSREFKRYSGISPAAFARKAKEGSRLVTGDFVAFVQA